MIDFFTIDPQADLADAVGRYEAATGEPLLPGDERYLFLTFVVSLILAAEAQTNVVANKNLLRYMEGELLDEYGAQYGVERLPAQYASATVEWSMALPLAYPVTIPSGTRVTPDGEHVFVLLEQVTIPAGQTKGAGLCQADQPGSGYNGFLPGQINSALDPVPGINGVANTTASAGGTDPEGDDAYKERIVLRWEGISTCGSKEGYEYWARQASASIVDVEAVGTEDAQVKVYILLEGAAQPSEELISQVLAAVSATQRRPLTDEVTVLGAEKETYNLSLTYYIARERSTQEAAIKTAVEAAIDAWVQERTRRLGGDLNPDGLRWAILQAGGYRVDIAAPVYTALEPQQVAVLGTKQVTYGGLL